MKIEDFYDNAIIENLNYKAEMYRQHYEDALDEIANLRRVVEELTAENEKLRESLEEISEEFSYYV